MATCPPIKPTMFLRIDPEDPDKIVVFDALKDVVDALQTDEKPANVDRMLWVGKRLSQDGKDVKVIYCACNAQELHTVGHLLQQVGVYYHHF